jgi:LytS/YehU family sensor histidine kinase
MIPLTGIIIALIYYIGGNYQTNCQELKFVHGLFMPAGLWLGCFSIVFLLWKKYPWEHHPVKHLVLEILLILAYTNAFAFGIYLLELKLGIVRTSENLFFEIFITNLITFLITTLHETIFFYRQWKLNFSKSIRLEKDNLEAKYDTLSAQINPHFLFNSLNSLTSIVDDNSKAVEYINNLSEFLRYTLEGKKQELVSLKDETDILKKYIALQKSRFQDNLKISLSIPKSTQSYLIPPLALQILVENCIKHNVITKDKPLSIAIRAEKDEISVENNLQKNKSEISTGHGLKNIKERYTYFTTKEVKIVETPAIFKVSVPLLELNQQ